MVIDNTAYPEGIDEPGWTPAKIKEEKNDLDVVVDL